MAASARPNPDRTRRLLLGGGLAAMAAGVSMVPASRASAAPATDTWKAGGNTNISTDGSNYLGTRNVAPLVFKTAATADTPLERMRILSSGKIGVGTTAPVARFEVVSSSGVAVQGTTTSTTAGVSGVQGLLRATGPSTNTAAVRGVSNSTNGNGDGVLGTHAGGGNGVHGTSVNGYGVYGDGGYTGTYGIGDAYGATGISDTGYGVYASGDTGVYATGDAYGVRSYASSYGVYGSGSYGVYGAGSSVGMYGTGNSYGLYGTGGIGVAGVSSTGSGVYGTSSDPNANAVWGTGGQYGVRGSSARTGGVRGDGAYVGVWAESSGTDGYAVNAVAAATSGQNFGIYALTNSAAGYAGYFNGRVSVSGTLTKSAGSFKIDHPLDPEHQWLSHSFVESPDMMNVYNGNIVLDGAGEATVPLPDYFTALNKDYRYQLTCIGGHADVFVAQEVDKNAFKIAGGTPGLKVSWQVTGIRQDDYANEHRIPNVTKKTGVEVGTRQFVPAGSSAKLMDLRPPTPADKQAPPPPLQADLASPDPEPAPPPRPPQG